MVTLLNFNVFKQKLKKKYIIKSYNCQENSYYRITENLLSFLFPLLIPSIPLTCGYACLLVVMKIICLQEV